VKPLLSVAVFVFVAAAQAADRPNIVFLLTDDQAAYSLGCYGNKDVQTPYIDSLSADGMTFDRHYNTTAICMASRANVMTGMYEYKTGCNFEHGPLMAEHWAKSYPILLRQAGYTTAFAGKFGFVVKGKAGKGTLPEKDFDRWGGGPGQTSYKTAKNKSMAEYAQKYPHSSRSYGAFGRDFILAAAKGDKPFCLSISFKAPHKPDEPDPIFDKVYAGKTFTKPANYGREYGAHFSKQSQQGRQYERFVSWGYRDNYDKVMAIYHQMVHGVDVAVGMIRKAVKDAGVEKNTVFIFTSDNGFFCGSHGYGSKVLPYEEASRVPLIIFDPRHASAGKKLRSKALTGNIDFAPTILELAGLAPTPNMDGKNLLPLLDDPTAKGHDALTLINVWGPQAAHSMAVVTQDWKFVYWPYAAKGFEPTEELYHLAKDPLELENAAKSDAESLKTMQAVYDQAVTAWKRNVVPYHGYEPYGTNFDRSHRWVPTGKTKKKKK
jgi:arylsulfatase A-like enzyme